MLGKYLDAVRAKKPLIHNITNYVTVNDVANMELACGASPIMADEPEEVRDIQTICNGLCINLGTLNRRTIPAMNESGDCAAELGHAILLDPVGAGASTLRTDTALALLDSVPFDVFRGNISEIRTLFAGAGNTHGVDAAEGDSVTEANLLNMGRFACSFAERFHTVCVISGAIDLVADAKTCYAIRNGVPEMSQITGTGCQLSGLTTCFIAANPEEKLQASAAAVAAMGLAGETALSRQQPGDGNATLRNRIIDAIYNMSGTNLDSGEKIERIIG